MVLSTGRLSEEITALVRQIQVLNGLMTAFRPAGQEDGGNSTSETLGGGGTFTGEWVSVDDWPQASVTVSVTAASAADGLKFQHSQDGTTVLHQHAYTLEAGDSRHFDEALSCNFFRVVFTDGGAGGDLDLMVKLHKYAPTAHAHPLSDEFNDEHPANIARSILAGFDAVSGLSKNVHTYATGAGVNGLVGLVMDPDGTPLTLYVEDGAKAGNAIGIAPLGVRDDALSTITPAEGDWTPFRLGADGSLWVSIAGAAGDPVTTFGVSAVDDEAFAVGVDSGTPAMGVFSADTVDAGDAAVVAIDANRRQLVVGATADDAADAGEAPVKVGGVADTDYTTPSTSQPGSAVSTDGDRAHIVLNERREILPAVIRQLFDLSALEDTYDNVTTTLTVTDIPVWQYREFQLAFSISVANTPTDIRVEVFTSVDGNGYDKLMDDGMGTLVFSTATVFNGIGRSYHFRTCAAFLEIVVTAVGTTASNTFTINRMSLVGST